MLPPRVGKTSRTSRNGVGLRGVIGVVKFPFWVRFALLLAVVPPLLVCAQQPTCMACCAQSGSQSVSFASASCCGEDCGPALENGRGGSCSLATRSAAGPGLTAVPLVEVFEVSPPAKAQMQGVFLASSPPLLLRATALRL